MNPQPWPKEPWEWRTVGTQQRLFDAKGNDITTNDEARKRLISCVSALKGIWFPEAAIPAMDDRINRLEKLRSEAWADAQSCHARLNNMEPAE